MSTKPSSGSSPDRSDDERPPGQSDDQPPLLVRHLLEAITLIGIVVLVAAGPAFFVGTVASFALGCGVLNGLVIAKQLLFFVGFGVLAFGAWEFRPRSPVKEGSGGLLGSDDEATDQSGSPGDVDEETTALQRTVARAPPARFVSLRPRERLGGGTRIILSGFTILAVTVVMDLLGLYSGNVPC